MHSRDARQRPRSFPPSFSFPFFTPSSVAAQEATPTMTYSCETAMTASPMAGMEGMAMGTPAAGDDHDMAGAERRV